MFAYGASKDKELGIPGEHLRGVYSARAFVGWYNGLPEFANLDPDLQSGDSAAILGQGNVALDVARVLLTPVDELRYTDIAEHAVAALSRSRITKVSIVGRRGPLQAPATIKEIRELMQIQGAHFLEPDRGWSEHLGVAVKALPRQMKRVMELLMRGSKTQTDTALRMWQFLYLLRPTQLLAAGDRSHVGSIQFEQMVYAKPMQEALESIVNDTKHLPDWERPPIIMNKIRSLRVVGSAQTDDLAASAVFRSIGYLSEPLHGMDKLAIQFDRERGIIPNDIHGRVLAPQDGPGDLAAAHIPGMYCAGWVKRGPTGVIASTLDDAFRTADIVVNDWESGVPFNKQIEEVDKLGIDGVQQTLKDRHIRSVSWADWEKIDQEERRRGKLNNKPREKIVSIAEMLDLV